MKIYHSNEYSIKLSYFDNDLFIKSSPEIIDSSEGLLKEGKLIKTIVSYWDIVRDFLGTENVIALNMSDNGKEIRVYEFDMKSEKEKTTGIAYWDSIEKKYCIEL